VRVRRSILNFATTALLLAVSMAVSLPATRWLLHWLGAPAFGGIRVLNTAFGYMTLLELGLGGALGPLLAGAINRGDDRALHETVAAGARAYFWVALSSISLGLVLTPVIPWFASDLNPAQVDDLRRGWLVQLTGFAVLTFLPLRSVFEARQLGYVVNLLLLAQSLLVTGVSLLLARAGWGITGQSAAAVLGNWAFSLAICTGAFRSHPGLFRSMLSTPTSPETRRSLRNLSVPNLLLNISGRVSVMSDDLIIGRMLGTARVTTLVNTQKLATMGQTILQSLGGASWAALAQLHTQGDDETFNRRLVEITRIIIVLGVVGLVPVLAYNRTFVRLWLTPEFPYGGDAVIGFACLNALLMGTQSLWSWCFVATGKIRAITPLYVLMMTVNLTTSVLATRQFGIPGPLIGSTVAQLALGAWALPILLRRTYGTPVGALFRAVALPAAAGALAAVPLCAFTRYVHEPAGWLGLAAEMSASALLLLGLSVTVLLTPEDRAAWRLRLAQIRPPRPVAVAAEGGDSAR
jgi:O-antigen/teichoic acid export membrane protein